MTDHAFAENAAVRPSVIKPRLILLAAMALVLAFLALTGGLRPTLTLDTPGYLSPWTWSELWGGRRTPFLGFLLAPFGDDFSLYPTVIIGLFFAAAYYLFGSLVRFGASERAALALTLPLLLSNSLVRYSSDVHAEFPSIVLLIYALGELLRLVADARPRPWRYAAFCAALGTAYLMRPSLLPFLIVMPALALCLGFVRQRRWRFRLTAVVLALSVAPFLLVSTIRYRAVNDFNVVSFGGFTLAGIASALLDERMMDRLAPEHRELARAVLDGREALVSTGEISPMVIDYKSGQRSYSRTARSYFDILANNFDELLYKVVVKERRPGESWVEFNRRVMSFSVAVIRESPKGYVMWIVGGFRSAVGTATAHNIAFVVGAVLLAGIYFSLLFTNRVPRLTFPRLDIPVLVLVTAGFTAGAGALPIVAAYPLIRYVSTAALFLPAILYYLAFNLAFEGIDKAGSFVRST